MDYDALLKELYGLERFGIKLGLDTITELLAHMGNPHRRLKTVHGTGTNRQRSVCAYVASTLGRAGHRGGPSPPPHPGPINERLQGDRRGMSQRHVARTRPR